MSRQTCFWTRKLELELVKFVRERDYIWKPTGNTNHHIHQKYRAYAEFAAKLGYGFTARSVRDRWVNIRSTFNHNLRRIEKSKELAKTSRDIYVPCWPLWKPLQFLREVYKKNETDCETSKTGHNSSNNILDKEVKEELYSDLDESGLAIRQRYQRTDRPRRKTNIIHSKHKKKTKSSCDHVINDLVAAMNPLISYLPRDPPDQSYWFFGRHITERLNNMKKENADSACHDIENLLNSSSATVKLDADSWKLED